MEKPDKFIIHVENENTGENFYFATLNAIYDVFTVEEIGKTYGSLRNYVISETNPYSYNGFVVRKVTLRAKQNVIDNRGNPEFKNNKK